jgi:hypothetical protein
MILIRNCPHDNGIYTILDNNQIIKSSYSADGITRLRKEHNGYRWYFERSGYQKKYDLVIKGTNSYCRSNIPYYLGDNGNPYKSISFNKFRLLKAIDAYLFVWPEKNHKMNCMHGDYSIGNIIFSKTDGYAPFIIDWEHFKEDIAPWGFDLANLLYESVFFTFRQRNSFSNSDIMTYVTVKRYILNRMGIENSVICNLKVLKKFIFENTLLWDGLVEKLPAVKISHIQCDFIDDIDIKYNLNME